jgi:RNA polymerase sigma-70 factor (ECF subfamily)
MTSGPVGTSGAGDFPSSEGPLSAEEGSLVEALLAGDESAFMRLVEHYGPVMLRIARAYAGSSAVAEEVVQEAWLGIIQSLPRFQRRSSLKTWMLRILKNIASRRAALERRSVPFSAWEEADLERDEPSVGPERFLDQGERWAGHWSSAPQRFGGLPEEKLLSRAALAVVESEMLLLSPNQRAVIELRDMQGWETSEVCELLEISEANQRVLLHRGRAALRNALEEYVDG